MFCFQCEQTAKDEGCTKIDVCGKQPDVPELQDILVYVLIFDISEPHGIRADTDMRVLVTIAPPI